ncbi:GumC family protein [Methylotuvimicrobium alcaliphilum]|uniref:Phage integrase n=1 Tax=Methylotuvimicrobium alcaliphilum (strain DSM 19304 / NCIMB 14124 / VKM B-2133 / 20Z) TaxID=1091494 RepID=G4SYY0_META2|nr:phage integrase [Methylotuvimicrobium alcaliphilum]CCE25437.1 Phage integrase [Methylotuvimicrobium alcaliphilum 20Z]
MNDYPPHIEVINDAGYYSPGTPPQRWFLSRLPIFLGVFLSALLIGLAFNYSRPAIYRSTATLLTSAMTAIDQVSETADIQHVAIQRQILLGRELLDETLKRLEITYPQANLTLEDVKEILQVQSLPDTQLVEMQAEGEMPEILPVLINTWIDVYLDARAAEIESSKGKTIQIVKDELGELEIKIEQARNALIEFRNEHDIASTERQENTVLAKLTGLTAALNNANEAEVKAKARLEAVEKAIEEGQAVVPTQDQRSLDQLEQRLQQLREKLAEFDKRYTREYLARQPSMRFIPEEIKKLEKEIAAKQQYGTRIVHTDAMQEYQAAKMTLDRIRQQLEDHKRMASEFSSRFAQHESLKADLDGLEKIYRETQERLVQIETRPVEKYPQVTVIDRAFLARDPISPNYNRDTLIIVIGSVMLGLFGVWLAEFLHPPREKQSDDALSALSAYANLGFGTGRLDLPQVSPERLTQIRNHQRLNAPVPRELSDADLRALLNEANTMGKQLIALLLLGVTLKEAAALTPEHLDAEAGEIRLSGPVPRTIPLDGLLSYFNGQHRFPAWYTDSPLAIDDLSAIISVAAIDAGMTHPEDFNADAIRHTYIVYLIRQGLKLSELESIVGTIAPADLVEYGRYSPLRPGLSVTEINRIHPALETEALPPAQ